MHEGDLVEQEIALHHAIVHANPLAGQHHVIVHLELVLDGQVKLHRRSVLHSNQVRVLKGRGHGSRGDELLLVDAMGGHGLVVLAVDVLCGHGHHGLTGGWVVAHSLRVVCAVQGLGSGLCWLECVCGFHAGAAYRAG